MLRAQGDAAGPLRVALEAAERARHEGRGAGRADFPGQGGDPRHLRRAQDVHAASGGRVRTSRKRARIMRERGWRGVARACAKEPSGEKRAPRRESAPDLLKRRFEADGPDMARFADIAYVRIRQGWLCLALVIGAWSRRMVGWSMGTIITAELADDALKMALARRNPPESCAHHSDRGSQYVSPLLSKTMREHGIRPSMGPVSSPWDNAAMEPPMGIVKAECAHSRTCATREEAALGLFERSRLQQGEGPFVAWLSQPRRVRRCQLAEGGRTPESGVKDVDEIGADSDPNSKLVRNGALFTYIEMPQELGGARLSTNNAIESINSRLRDMLRHCRGMPLLNRVKAIFW